MSENKHTPGEWRYDIQYGPNGEANFAWVYDEAGEMVGTMRTRKAAKIVSTMNAAPDILAALIQLEGAVRIFPRHLDDPNSAMRQAVLAISKALEGKE